LHDSFSAESDTLQFALAHIIQVIGEAADHVSEEFKEAQPQFPWHEIIGMRHQIVIKPDWWLPASA
jgi:uncharacterized protein with HEPN domain